MSTDGRERPLILIVEDEWIVAETISQTVKDAGYGVLGPARGAAEALDILSGADIAGALLDVSIGGDTSFEVADELARRSVPFVFMTGYATEDLPPAYRSAAILGKPVSPESILDALRSFGRKPREL